MRATVERVVDGDTVVLAGVGKARLIGVDTPEVYGGRRVLRARRPRTTRNASWTDARCATRSGRGERDRYGRALVYLWLADGRSFNALLVSRGYAQPLTVPPDDDYADIFVRLARRARERSVGLWAPGACAEEARRAASSPKERPRRSSWSLTRDPDRWSNGHQETRTQAQRARP